LEIHQSLRAIPSPDSFSSFDGIAKLSLLGTAQRQCDCGRNVLITQPQRFKNIEKDNEKCSLIIRIMNLLGSINSFDVQ
jgi:hypothetical protein